MGKRDTKDLLKELTDKGWRIEQGRRAHYKAYHPKGGMVVIACSPSCPRDLQNTLMYIRRLERQHGESPKEGGGS